MRYMVLLSILMLSACGRRVPDLADLEQCNDFDECMVDAATAFAANQTCGGAESVLQAAATCASLNPCVDGDCGVCWPNQASECKDARAALVSCDAAPDAAVSQFNVMCENIERDSGSNIIPPVESR